MAQVVQMEGHGNGNGNGGHPPNDQDGWSRVDQVMDASAPSGMPGQPVDENFWAEIGVWFSEDGTGQGQNGTMPPMGGGVMAPQAHDVGNLAPPQVKRQRRSGNGHSTTARRGQDQYLQTAATNTVSYILSNPARRPLAVSWLRQMQSDRHPMANPLPAAVAGELLQDDDFQPGPRPRVFSDPDACYIFKEHLGHRTAVYGQQQDRWHNSGGVKGSRDLPIVGPVVRRRYGSLIPAGAAKSAGLRYHEYALLKVDGSGSMTEDGTVRLFHVMPRRDDSSSPATAQTSKGKGSQEEAAAARAAASAENLGVSVPPSLAAAATAAAKAATAAANLPPTPAVILVSSVKTVAGMTARTGGDYMVSRAFIGGSMVSTQMSDAQFMPALAGRICGLYVRASVSPGTGQACKLVLFRNGEPTLLSVLLQSGDTKGVAQANDAIANLASVAGVAGKVGRRPGPDLHSIVRVEPTDDLTICITPSAGARAAYYQVSLQLLLPGSSASE